MGWLSQLFVKRQTTSKTNRTLTPAQMKNRIAAKSMEAMIAYFDEHPDEAMEYGAQLLRFKRPSVMENLRDQLLSQAIADGDESVKNKLLDKYLASEGLKRDDPFALYERIEGFLTKHGGRGGGGLFSNPELLVEGMKVIGALLERQALGNHNGGMLPAGNASQPQLSTREYTGPPTDVDAEPDDEPGSIMFSPALDKYIIELLDRVDANEDPSTLAQFAILRLNQIGIEEQRTDPSLEKFSMVRSVLFMPSSILAVTLKSIMQQQEGYEDLIERLETPQGQQYIQDFSVARDKFWAEMKAKHE